MRQRLAGDQPDHHAADQPGPGGRGDRIDIGERHAGIGQRRLDQRLQRLDMRARRDLRHHAAIRRVRRLLSRQPVREDAAVAGDQRRGGFVAARIRGRGSASRRSASRLGTRLVEAGSIGQGAGPCQRFRLGTRGSPLALAQADMVRDALCAAHGWATDAVEIVPIRTTGDRVQDRALAEIGGKALWTKELDRALLDRRDRLSRCIR